MLIWHKEILKSEKGYKSRPNDRFGLRDWYTKTLNPFSPKTIKHIHTLNDCLIVWLLDCLSNLTAAATFNFQFSLFTFHLSLFNFHFSLFTFHLSLFNFHFSIFTFHLSLFTFHFSPFTFHLSLFNFQFPPFTFHFSLFTFHISLFTFHFSIFNSQKIAVSVFFRTFAFWM